MLFIIIDCFLLSFIPTIFIKEVCKLKGIHSFIMLLVYFFLSYYFIYTLIHEIRLYSLSCVSILLCLTFFIYKYLLKNNFYAIYYSAYINHLIVFIILLCLFALDFFEYSPIISINVFFCIPIIFIVSFSLFYLFKNLHLSIIEYFLNKKKRFIIVNILCLILLSFYIDLYQNNIYKQSIHGIEMIVELIILLIIYLIFLKSAYNKTLKQNQLITKIIEQQTLEFQKIIENEKTVRQLKHNMKHVLLSLLEQYDNDPQQMKRIINKQLEQLDNQEKVINTGNSSLDLIINYYMPSIKEKNIDLIVNYFQYQSVIESSDFYIILGNILENAIENCNNKLKNKIIIYSSTKDTYYYIQIKNTIDCTSEIYLQKSSKRDLGHGFGIESINKLVKKNYGKVYFSHDDLFFYVDLYLPLDLKVD